MRFKTIGEVTKSVQTWTPRSHPDSNINYIDLSAVDNETKRISSPQYINSAEAPSRARQLLLQKDVLVSTVRPNLNAVALVTQEFHGATASTGFSVLRPSEEVDSNYLFHWVRTTTFVNEMISKASGASYPAVSDKIVKQSRLPLPDIEEQRRIAAILDQADHLHRKIALRASLVSDLPDLEFAALQKNQKTVSLRELADIKIGPFGSALHKSDYKEGGICVINPMHIIKNKITPNTSFSISESKASELSQYRLEVGDIVLGRRGELGRAGIVYPDNAGMLCGTGSMIIRPRSGVDTRFLHAALTSKMARDYFSASAMGATMPSLNSRIVLATPVPDPNAIQSDNFLKLVDLLIPMEIVNQDLSDKASELVNSLQSRAFCGELQPIL